MSNISSIDSNSTLEPQRISIPSHVEEWDAYFLHIAEVVSIKSKDRKCPVGAVVVSEDKIVLSTGFNGLPRGVYDDDRTLTDTGEKLRVICHAENNAVFNAARIGGRPLQDATIYVTKFPCLSCCLSLIQAGIKRIYTHADGFWKNDPADGTHERKKRVLHEAGIKVDAPFHPDFMPKERIAIQKKPPLSQAPGESSPGMSASAS